MTRRRARSGAPYFVLGLAAFAWAAAFGAHVTARQDAAQTGETRKLPGCRRLVRDGVRLLVRWVEEMLGGIAFHGGCIGRAVAPLEG